MIGRLKGTLLEKQAPFLLLDVNGVGYNVEAPLSTFFSLPNVGEKVRLHIKMIVRDDAHLLFGFLSLSEKKMFESLIKVNGVGAKMGLAILSSMDAGEFVGSIRNKDVNQLIRIPGVGKKTAERLIVEMTDKIKDWGEIKGVSGALTGTLQGDVKEEAIQALVALGYKTADANARISKIGIEGQSVENIIRQALKN